MIPDAFLNQPAHVSPNIPQEVQLVRLRLNVPVTISLILTCTDNPIGPSEMFAVQWREGEPTNCVPGVYTFLSDQITVTTRFHDTENHYMFTGFHGVDPSLHGFAGIAMSPISMP